MIEVRIEPYCEKCPDFEAETQKLYSCDNIVHIIVRCEHARRCNAIAERLKQSEVSK